MNYCTSGRLNRQRASPQIQNHLFCVMHGPVLWIWSLSSLHDFLKNIFILGVKIFNIFLQLVVMKQRNYFKKMTHVRALQKSRAPPDYCLCCKTKCHVFNSPIFSSLFMHVHAWGSEWAPAIFGSICLLELQQQVPRACMEHDLHSTKEVIVGSLLTRQTSVQTAGIKWEKEILDQKRPNKRVADSLVQLHWDQGQQAYRTVKGSCHSECRCEVCGTFCHIMWRLLEIRVRAYRLLGGWFALEGARSSMEVK